MLSERWSGLSARGTGGRDVLDKADKGYNRRACGVIMCRYAWKSVLMVFGGMGS